MKGAFIMHKGKVTAQERIEAARACLEGRTSKREAAQKLGVSLRSVKEWIARYKAHGASAFQEKEYNTAYPEYVKLSAVEEYLGGKGSLKNISAKYGLRSTRQLRDWIKMYNSGVGFGRKMSGGSRMKQGRETTQKERIAIAMDCLENGGNYGQTAIKFNVSYQQVYTWVKKFKEMGAAGLEDRRGKNTAAQEPRTELEEIKIKMAQLEHELYMTKMERDLLKKLNELERGDASHK